MGLSSLALLSCKKDDEETAINNLVGTWKPTKSVVYSGANNSVLLSQNTNSCESKSRIELTLDNRVNTHTYSLEGTQCIDDGASSGTYTYDPNTKKITVVLDGETTTTTVRNLTSTEMQLEMYYEDLDSDGKKETFVMFLNK